MSADRDITEVVQASFTSRVRRGGPPATVARELIAIAKAHGVRFAVPAHWHDPAADHRTPIEPGDQQAGHAAALAALGKGICQACGGRVDLTDDGLVAPHEISDNPPHPPFHPCPGGQPEPHTSTDIEVIDIDDGATDEPTDDPTDQEPGHD
jgi:hypothetical protein